MKTKQINPTNSALPANTIKPTALFKVIKTNQPKQTNTTTRKYSK